MKSYCFAFLLTLVPALVCLGQAKINAPKHPSQRVIMMTGVGVQLSSSYGNQCVLLSVETPVGDFWHLGVQGGQFISDVLYVPSSRNAGSFFNFRGGYEVGGFSKYFLHGRLSGQKSAFYWGPEIRLGTLHSEGEYYGDFSASNYIVKNTRHTKQYLIRWGFQWRTDRHFVCELALPLGWEYSKSITRGFENGVELTPSVYKYDQFVMLPSLQLGFAF